MSASDAAGGPLPARSRDDAKAAVQPAAAAKKKKYISVGALAMVNVAAVLSLRNLPVMAQYGWASVTWYFLGLLLFLLPCALIGAELATGPWPQQGGLYSWVRAGLNDRWGMISVWCDWSDNIVWFPTVLAFIAATLAFVVNPQLANNGAYMLTVMLVTFWLVTIIAFFGARNVANLTSVTTILGSILPIVLLVAFMCAYLFSGKTSQIPVSAGAFKPSFALSSLPFVASIVLIFSGMEVAGYSADQTRKPQRDFPRAMIWSALLIFVLTVLGTIAVAVVVPAKDINLTAGLMQAFQGFYATMGVSWMTPVTAILVFVGYIAGVGAWVYGPAKGLNSARGYLPPVFYRSNKRGAPVAVLLIQAVLGSILSLLFVLLPSVSAAYWVLTCFTTEVMCVLYILMFASGLRMRRLKPVSKFPRGFTAGNNLTYYTLCVFGMVAVVFALFIGLFPTSQTSMGTAGYVATIAVGTIVLAFFPFVFLPFRKPSWSAAGPSDTSATAAGQPPADGPAAGQPPAGTAQPSPPAPGGKVGS